MSHKNLVCLGVVILQTKCTPNMIPVQFVHVRSNIQTTKISPKLCQHLHSFIPKTYFLGVVVIYFSYLKFLTYFSAKLFKKFKTTYQISKKCLTVTHTAGGANIH